ncbi:MAG: glycosyltransferase family 2 protein [Cognatishimia sp.]
MNKPKVIVSLSTIPPRFEMLGATLTSILRQNTKIDEIRVNIPKTYRRFPEHNFSLPEVPEGVRIAVCDEDYGPATKILPTLMEYHDQDAQIIFCDDDRICDPRWALNLLQKSNERPDDAIANCGWHLDKLKDEWRDKTPNPRAQPLPSRFDLVYRGRRIAQQLRQPFTNTHIPKPSRAKNFSKEGYLDILEGCGGVLVKPHFFSREVFKVPEKVWSVDDIWLSGMLRFNKRAIWANGRGLIPSEQRGAADDALCNDVIEGLNRRQANIACVEYLQAHYEVWIDREDTTLLAKSA